MFVNTLNIITGKSSLFDLTGKTALITGASSGLGEQFARCLSQAGARVILAARRLHKLQALEKEIGNAVALELDVSDKASVRKAFEVLETAGERLDVCVNNAGIARITPLFEAEDSDDFEHVLQTNLTGVWYVTQATAIHMKQHKISGSIINISSIYGHNKLEGKQAAYCASKAAVTQLTKALVGELSEHNIRINAIAPGYFLTPMVPPWVREVHEAGKTDTLIPQKFLATPKELNGTLLYLASNEASRYVTGSCITVDGGISWGG